MPDVLYKHSWDNSTSVIRYNDYDYSTESFYFRYDSNGRKLKRYMQHFENLGDISKELASGAQHDTYTGFPYIPSLIDSRYGYPTGTPLNTENGFLPYETGQPNVCGVSSLSEDFTTSHFTGDVSMKALDRLLAQEDEQPFFLTVSFHNPHPPMIPAQKHVDYYWERRENLFVSPSINDPMDNSDYGKGLPQYQNKTKVQEWTALYYALVEEIDEYVGAMLSRLGDAADDTLIIFTSDHGEMLGAHGKREKNMFYEEAAKVPLFISFPGRIKPNVVVDDVVSHLDVYATIMDYIGAPEVDHSDGSSLRRFIEGSTNAEYDENVVVAEWDYRKPLLSNHQVLDRRIDERPSLMIRKGMYKLMVQKKAESNEIDMMFDLQSDPYEVNNLLGKNAMSASQTTLAKAEHLRCLLIDWMERMDGTEGEGYYSDPLANYGEGGGDIEELSKRQSWRQLDFWIGDAEIKFDRIPWNASSEKFLRSEYLYLGKRTPGSITVSRVRIEGSDAHYFSVDKSHLIISQNQCQRIKVTFAASKNETPPGKIEASIVLERQGASDTVQISVDDMAFDTTPSLARSTTLVPTSSGPTVAPSKIASSMPTSSEPTVAPSKIPSTQPTKSPASHDSPALFGGFFVGFWEDITDSITEEMLNEMP